MNNEMTKDYATSFAAWELRLYLDTHPYDERAYAAYKQLCSSQGCTYACNVIGSENKTGSCCEIKPTPAPIPMPYNRIPGNFRQNTGCAGQNNAGHYPTPHCHEQRERVWHWIDDPWPWEPEANVKGGHC